jgi:hypothetical protein
MKIEDVDSRPAYCELFRDGLTNTTAATRNYCCLSVQPERSRHYKPRSEE